MKITIWNCYSFLVPCRAPLKRLERISYTPLSTKLKIKYFSPEKCWTINLRLKLPFVLCKKVFGLMPWVGEFWVILIFLFSELIFGLFLAGAPLAHWFIFQPFFSFLKPKNNLYFYTIDKVKVQGMMKRAGCLKFSTGWRQRWPLTLTEKSAVVNVDNTFYDQLNETKCSQINWPGRFKGGSVTHKECNLIQ